MTRLRLNATHGMAALLVLWGGGLMAPMSAAQDGALPGVLDLETVQRIALADNPSLLAAQARVEQAELRVRQAKAAYYPSLDASVTASVTSLPDRDVRAARNGALSGSLGGLSSLIFNPPETPVGSALQLFSIATGISNASDVVDRTAESYAASVGATWLLFDGLGRKFRIAAARSGAREFDAAYDDAARLLFGAVALAYHNVQLARENIAIAKADEAFNRRQLRESEARRRVGTGSLSDVLNFDVRVKAAQTDLLEAERNYNTALIGLMELMGVDSATVPEGQRIAALEQETAEEMTAPDALPLLEYAMLHRPDLQRSRLTIETAKAGVGISKSSFYPVLSAFASRDAFRSRNIGFTDEDFSSTIGISATFNLFSGGRRWAVLREAKLFETEIRRRRRSTELVVASEVRRSREVLITSQKTLVLQRESTTLVERNRDLVEKEYRAGQGSLVRLNEAQRDLISQQSRLALILVALRQNWHDLRTATAETLALYSD